jgi:hypothetical protein
LTCCRRLSGRNHLFEDTGRGWCVRLWGRVQCCRSGNGQTR